METKDPPTFVRQQLLIEHSVQGPLLQRAALYSGACAVYFVVILVFSRSVSMPHETLAESLMHCLDDAIFWAPGLIFLVPLMAYDLLRMTNRFAGPVFRLRREMQRLVAGESERPLSFRDEDYWTDFAGVFNDLRTELMELREQKKTFESAQTDSGAEGCHSQLFGHPDNETADDFLSSV